MVVTELVTNVVEHAGTECQVTVSVGGEGLRIEVRDFVALKLACLLEIEVELKRDRTPAEWAELRQKVRVDLKRELDKPK